MTGAGYNYLCCAGTNYQLCKNGFTKTADPYTYCRKEFGRTYQPLNIISVIPVADATLCENISHFVLASKKVGNEVFDMRNRDGTFNQELWDKNERIIREANELSGLAMPESLEVILDRKLLAQAEKQKLMRQRRAERQAEQEAEAAERKRRKREEKAAEERAREEQLARERAAYRVEVETETSELLDDFIINSCKVIASGRVAVSELQKSFAEYTGQDTPRMFSSIMLNKGFCNKTIIDDKVRKKAYIGITLNSKDL